MVVTVSYSDTYENNMKNYILIQFDGIYIYFDNTPVIHINFNNVDNSTFKVPFAHPALVNSFNHDVILISA